MFDSKGSYVDIIGEGEIRPRGVVTDTVEGNMAAVDTHDKTIKMFDPLGRSLGSWTKFIFDEPHGIAVTADDKFVITDLGQQTARVNVYDPEGMKILQFGSCHEGNDYLKSPNFVAVDQHDRILVSDWANHCVKVFDIHSGKLVDRFGKRGQHDGELFYPNGIAVDQQDRIFIADNGNHRICMFSAQGKFLQSILDTPDGIMFPEALAIGDSGLIVFTESGIAQDYVKAYQM